MKLSWVLTTFFTVCFLTTVLTAIPFVVQATVVALKNGDRMTGRIVKMENKRLKIDLPSAGIIKIRWEDVQSVTTERPMSVMLYGEADLPEGSGERDLDRMILSTLGKDGTIRLEDVRAINISGSLTCRIAGHRLSRDGDPPQPAIYSKLVGSNVPAARRVRQRPLRAILNWPQPGDDSTLTTENRRLSADRPPRSAPGPDRLRGGSAVRLRYDNPWWRRASSAPGFRVP